MSNKRKITIEIEATIYDGSIFVMYSCGTYRLPGQEHAFQVGMAGGSLVAYLPDHKAIGIEAGPMIEAGLTAIGWAIGTNIEPEPAADSEVAK